MYTYRYIQVYSAVYIHIYIYMYIYTFTKLRRVYCFASFVGFEETFQIEKRSTSQGLPYDFGSIMHFLHNAFSRDQLQSTVVPHSRDIGKTVLGGSATATDLNFLHLKLLYCGGMNVILMH